MQLSDGFDIGEVGILRKGWYFTRKCDGWETSATHRHNSRSCFKEYLMSWLTFRIGIGLFEDTPLLPEVRRKMLWYVESLDSE
jgi:hypothetical protein